MSGDERRFDERRRSGPLTGGKIGERRRGTPLTGEEAYQELERAVAAYGERECQLDQVIDAARDQNKGVYCAFWYPTVSLWLDGSMHQEILYATADLDYEDPAAISGMLWGMAFDFETFEFVPSRTIGNVRIARDQTVTLTLYGQGEVTLNATCRGSILTAPAATALGERQAVVGFKSVPGGGGI